MAITESGILTDVQSTRVEETWNDPAHAEQAWTYRREEAFERLYRPRSAPKALPENDVVALCDFAREAIGDVPLLYLEFGVYQGESIRRAAERFQNPESRFIGFDSFEGLPEDWVLPWSTLKQGSFSTEGSAPSVADLRISFRKGWFQNTVHPFINDSADLKAGRQVFVHFDADIYSSTSFLLSSLWPAFDDYYFMCNDFIEHDVIALYDFSNSFPVEIRFLCQTKQEIHPNQVFGHMRRTVFELT